MKNANCMKTVFVQFAFFFSTKSISTTDKNE